MIKFSIIIPHYNSPLLLKQLLISIGSKEGVEVIVVDDKSDRFKAEYEYLSEQFKSKQAKFIDNNTDFKGAGVCRNLGIRASKGQWLIFADADDLMEEDWFKTIESKQLDNAEIHFFRPKSLMLAGHDGSKRHVEYDKLVSDYISKPTLYIEDSLRFKFYPTWSKVYSSKLIKKNRIEFESRLHANDMLFTAKAGFYAENIQAYNEPIYVVREHKYSLTKIKKSHSDVIERLEAYINYVDFLKQNLDESRFKKLGFRMRSRLKKAILSKPNPFTVIKVVQISLKSKIPF